MPLPYAHPVRALALLCCCATGSLFAQATAPVAGLRPPVKLVLDTDMCDVDDPLCLALIHALVSRKEAQLLAVTLSKKSPQSAAFVDAINSFYGRGDIPIGEVVGGVEGPILMQRLPVRRKREDGSPLYGQDIQPGQQTPDAVTVLRQTLAAQADGSVTMLQVGHSTNLARLLRSKPDAHSGLSGMDLVRRKVRLLSVMAGAIAKDMVEY